MGGLQRSTARCWSGIGIKREGLSQSAGGLVPTWSPAGTPVLHEPAPPAASAAQAAGLSQHFQKHRHGQPSGEGILLARVVAPQQMSLAGQKDMLPVGKLRRAACKPSPAFQFADQSAPRDSSQGHQHSGRDDVQGFAQPQGAIVQFVRSRFVAGGCTMADGRNGASAQSQAVLAVDRGGLVCQPQAVQRLKEPLAASVAGKHAPRTVGSVGRRGQADQQDGGRRIAEVRNRLAPIFPVLESAPAPGRHFTAILAQSRTLVAPDNAAVQSVPPHRRR